MNGAKVLDRAKVTVPLSFAVTAPGSTTPSKRFAGP